MIMRKLFVLCITLAACGCQKSVTVPTIPELMKNPQLLAEWQAKCDTGEYSHLPADQHENYCFNERQAAHSVEMTKRIGDHNYQ
jgi:hypothetical protein